MVLINFVFGNDIYIKNYDDLITATNNLTKPIDQRWIFVDKDNKIAFEDDPNLTKYFHKYFYYMLDNQVEIQVKSIPTKAMENTIYKNESVFVFKGINRLFRGGVFAFYYPKDKKTIYLKRCMATGGDVIFLKDKALYFHPVEGNEFVKKNYKGYKTETIQQKIFVKEPYKKQYNGIHYDLDVTKKSNNVPQLFDSDLITVPNNECFMIGDNRDHSNDSRFWGSVHQDLIIGISLPVKLKRRLKH